MKSIYIVPLMLATALSSAQATCEEITAEQQQAAQSLTYVGDAAQARHPDSRAFSFKAAQAVTASAFSALKGWFPGTSTAKESVASSYESFPPYQAHDENQTSSADASRETDLDAAWEEFTQTEQEGANGFKEREDALHNDNSLAKEEGFVVPAQSDVDDAAQYYVEQQPHLSPAKLLEHMKANPGKAVLVVAGVGAAGALTSGCFVPTHLTKIGLDLFLYKNTSLVSSVITGGATRVALAPLCKLGVIDQSTANGIAAAVGSGTAYAVESSDLTKMLAQQSGYALSALAIKHPIGAALAGGVVGYVFVGETSKATTAA